MNITHLIKHPEELDKETLYDLRSLIALYPYYQPARILLLQNLFLLHDPTFDEELRRAAVYITNRQTLFELVEAAHYKPQQVKKVVESTPSGDRTTSLIDDFLSQIPKSQPKASEETKKPTPADATIDYVSYLLQSDNGNQEHSTPELKGQTLIDNFISNESGKITLQEEPEYEPLDIEEPLQNDQNEYFTETLARIYIQQGRYATALEIIKRLDLAHPKKNSYFADQIRFLEKLIINNKQ